MVKLDMFLTAGFAVLALRLGEFLKRKIRFLEKFCIPAPVVGGILFSVLSCILYVTGLVELSFDETIKDVCMMIFFTTVGFGADLKSLRKGGISVLIFLLAVTMLILLQNITAIGISALLGIDPLLGLCTGSIPMVGGHGTAGAFGPLLEKMGVGSANTMATAAATFGLIGGSLMGGPVGKRLIERNGLLKTASPPEEPAEIEEPLHTADGVHANPHPHSRFADAVVQIALAMALGSLVSTLLRMTGMTFPGYMGGLLVGVIFRNTGELSGKFRVHVHEIKEIGNVSLSLFLGIAMITLRLWELFDLALPFLVLLAGQAVLMFVFVYFPLFRMLGGDYDAAVLCAGTCGFGMGATPNAMANMQALTEVYLPSEKAYLLVPVVGSMFADLLNSMLITAFINIL